MQRYVFNRAAAAATASATANSSSFFFAASASSVFARRTVVDEFNGSHDEFNTRVAKGLTLVDCYTDWCGPCQQMNKPLKDLSEKFTGVKFIKVNVEENEDVGALLNVRSIPYFVMFEDGKQIGSVEGANQNKLGELVETASKRPPPQ